MADLALSPESFEDLRKAVPDGYSLSERVVDPVLILDRDGSRISARLSGRRQVKGREVLMPAPSNRHAWVADGDMLRPLPADIGDALARVVQGADTAELSYAAAIALIRMRADIIEVRASDGVLHSGRIAAEELPSEVNISGLLAQGNRASEAFDECTQEVIAPARLLELYAV